MLTLSKAFMQGPLDSLNSSLIVFTSVVIVESSTATATSVITSSTTSSTSKDYSNSVLFFSIKAFTDSGSTHAPWDLKIPLHIF